MADMRNQTFGVEIEMNNITRDKAAEIVARFFGTDHYENTALRNGYSTWSAWDQQGREWKFQKDVSIYGDDAHKCEMVTPILRYEDMEDLQEIVRRLRHAGAKSYASRGCGVHIQIGADGHNARTLRNLTNIIASHEDLLIKALKIADSRTCAGGYCRPTDPRFLQAVNTKKPKTMADLADVWYESQGCTGGRTAHYNPSRYHMLNLHATFTKGTVEFRLFQFDEPGRVYKGGLHAGKIKAYIQLCLALSNRAKEVRSAKAEKLISDNDKYTMRVWLLHLGFIGDEFKTARDMLTRNLTGNAAHRRVA